MGYIRNQNKKDGLWFWWAQSLIGKCNIETLAPSLTVVTLVLVESDHENIPVYEENWLLKFNVNNKHHHDHYNLSAIMTNRELLNIRADGHVFGSHLHNFHFEISINYLNTPYFHFFIHGIASIKCVSLQNFFNFNFLICKMGKSMPMLQGWWDKYVKH